MGVPDLSGVEIFITGKEPYRPGGRDSITLNPEIVYKNDPCVKLNIVQRFSQFIPLNILRGLSLGPYILDEL